MKVSFTAARRINMGIRVIAALIAAVPVPFVIIVLLIFGAWWGLDFTVSGIFGGFIGSLFVYFQDMHSVRSRCMPRALPQKNFIVLQHATSNQSMKPTAPFRNKSSVFATTPCRGLSFHRLGISGWLLRVRLELYP